MPPRRALLLFGLWFLVTTWPHKLPDAFMLFSRALVFGRNGRKEGRWELRHGCFVRRAQRFDEMRRDHHKKFRICLFGGTAAEQLPQNWNVAEAGKFVNSLNHPVVDQPGNGEALTIFKD